MIVVVEQVGRPAAGERGGAEMRMVIAGLCLTWMIGSVVDASPTSQRGAYAILSHEEVDLSFYAEETSDVPDGSSTSEASLTLTRDGATETVACTWAMPDDPVLLGAATLDADCGTYTLVAEFRMNGGGTGEVAIACWADVSRPMRATVRVRGQDGVTVVFGVTENSRVWRHMDLGTCSDEG